jgi:hypothetical protein
MRCVEGVTQSYKHNGYTIGPGGQETWAENSIADAGLVYINSTLDVHDYFLAKNGGSGLRHLTSWLGNNAQHEQDIVCSMGAGSAANGYDAKKCGVITDVDGGQDVDGKWILHMNTVNFDSCPGDSGGSVYQNPDDHPSTIAAYGTHSDSDAGCHPNQGGHHSWYAPIGRSLTALQNRFGIDVDVCTENDPC